MSEYSGVDPAPRYPVLEDLPDPVREGDPRLDNPRPPLPHDHGGGTVYWDGGQWIRYAEARNFVSPATKDPSVDQTPQPGETWDVVEEA